MWAYVYLGTVEPQAFDIFRSFEIVEEEASSDRRAAGRASAVAEEAHGAIGLRVSQVDAVAELVCEHTLPPESAGVANIDARAVENGVALIDVNAGGELRTGETENKR